jgi:hypothetical protein
LTTHFDLENRLTLAAAKVAHRLPARSAACSPSLRLTFHPPQGKNFLIKKDITAKTDQLSHVYTLRLSPNNTYQVRSGAAACRSARRTGLRGPGVAPGGWRHCHKHCAAPSVHPVPIC